MRTLAVLLIGVFTALALVPAAIAGPQGWRFDGSGRWPDVAPPVRWTTDEGVAFRTPLPAWSNASPVIAGGKVCALSEPVTLWCADAASGELLWSVDLPVLDVLEGAARVEAAREAALREQAEAELRAARDAYSRLVREARRVGDTSLAPQIDAAARAIDRIRGVLAPLPDLTTPASQSIVGWSSPTPVTDGSTIYALFAHGVIAAYSLEGERRWARWLGPPLPRMLGWDGGHAASPVLVGGVLVVPYGRLRGLDPATGETRWEGQPWPHFGAPTPFSHSGVAMLATPDGRLVRARDGHVLATDLADVWYVNPVVDGDRLYFLEARSDAVILKEGGVVLRAWRVLGVDGDRARVAPSWTTTLPVRRSFYTPPVVVDGVVHAITHAGEVYTVDAASGAPLPMVEIAGMQPTRIYASPALAGGRLYVVGEDGRVAVIAPGRAPSVLAVNPGWPGRASPAFSGRRLYLRTRDAIVAVGP